MAANDSMKTATTGRKQSETPKRSAFNRTQYCSALNCRNTRAKNRKLSFFRFPKDKDRCRKWVDNCRRIELQQKDPDALYRNYVFCADHFEDSQFMNVQARNRLVWNAIPTIFDVPDPPLTIAEEKARGSPFFPLSPPKEDSDDNGMMAEHIFRATPEMDLPNPVPVYDGEDGASIQDEVSAANTVPLNGRQRLAAIVLTPQQIRLVKMRQLVNRQRIKIWRLQKQVQALKSKAKTIDTPNDIVRYAARYMSQVSLNFFVNQIRMAAQKNHGKRWMREDKYFSLILNCISADAYHFCSKVFNLPSVRTLQRWLREFRREPDFEQQLHAYRENLLRDTNETINVFHETSSDSEQAADSHPTAHSLQPRDVDKSSAAPIAPTVSDLPNPQPTASEMPATALLSPDTFDVQGPARYCPLQSMTRQLCLKPGRRKRLKTAGAKKRRPELLASPDAPFEQRIKFQLHSDATDQQTLQFLATGSKKADDVAAIHGLSPDGALILTPIASGIPVTIAGDILNLEIVTLDSTAA